VFEISGDALYKKLSNDDNKEKFNSSKSPGKFKLLKTRFEIANPYLKAVCIFLGNKQDRANMSYDEIVLMEDISVRDRFSFAKKFLTPTQYTIFKDKIR
jgi:hypothetical protein